MSGGQTLSEEQKTALKNAFEDIDINGTGKISKSELRAALQLIGQNPTSEEMITYMERLGDGDFTLDEFLEYVEQRIPIKSQEEIDKELMDAFEKFNDDRDFLISKEEFKKVMTKLGDEPLTEGDAEYLLESLRNIEKNGMFNVAELARLFMG
ncbi:centrin-2-like [Mercenaria mercenaria]|uniref:centrin-2-like n=1 Tax=Mercenaria mercenaria TaxID=6596 RepID=UPI001E1D8738|nr:centrin-2-like [Mercenaria mercenaria]